MINLHEQMDLLKQFNDKKINKLLFNLQKQ
jgi:hypothetical protein